MMRAKWWRAVLLVLAVALIAGGVLAASDPAERIWYAVEMNGKLIGYSLTERFPARSEDSAERESRSKLELKLTALGQPFDVRVESTMRWGESSSRPRSLKFELARGSDTQKRRIRFIDGKAQELTESGEVKRELMLEAEVIVEDEVDYTLFVTQIDERMGSKLSYKAFEPIRFEIHEKTITRVGRETIILLGKKFDSLVFEVLDRGLGLKTKIWVDRTSHHVLRTEASTGIVTWLADESILERVERGDLDTMIFGRVKVAIPNFTELSSMKLKVTLRTLGEWVTRESLNQDGQRFEGVVEENLIEGIFEISWPRYDGVSAPAFPGEYNKVAIPEKYFLPEEMVESDAPEIHALAIELTKGAADSWEAAKRLSQWVSDEIAYSIPGGSAQHTFETRKGECASHSRLLTALCRTVGIPARIVSGGVYNPLQGGSFGQHAWVELWMGPAGWVPVDPTMHEIDYADAGHLRLGERASFNPTKIRVLDYKAGKRSMGSEPVALMAVQRVPFEVDVPYRFVYRVNGQRLGSETLTLSARADDGSVTGHSVLDLGVLKGTVDWAINGKGFPTAFRSEGVVRDVEISVACVFEEGKVRETVLKGEQKIEREVELPEGARLIDNNNLGLMNLLLASMPQEEGAVRSVQVFHPSSTQLLAAEITALGKETIELGGQQIEARHYEMVLAGTPISFWLDEHGLLLRNSQQNGAVVIDLERE